MGKRFIKPQDQLQGGRSTSSAHDGIFKHEWKDGKEHQHGYANKDQAMKDTHTKFPVKIIGDKIKHTRE